MKYSVVIPFYNEEDSVYALTQEVTFCMGCLQEVFEIILVNDGSTDNTHSEINRAAIDFSTVQSINLSQRHGKSVALQTGFN